MSYFREVELSKDDYLVINQDLASFFRRFASPSASPTDLVADTWLVAVRTFEGKCSLREFLFLVAKRQAADTWRRRRRRPPVTSLDAEAGNTRHLAAEGPGPETCLTLAAGKQAMAGGLEMVGEAYRDVVRLWLAGCDNFQIAAELGISYNTARSRLSRGQAQLTAALKAVLEVE